LLFNIFYVYGAGFDLGKILDTMGGTLANGKETPDIGDWAQ
jgi:hypothetical protein